MTKLRGADVVVEVLARAGIEYIAGVPGHTVIDVLDALRTRTDKMRAIIVRNEESAGYIADAYYRISGKPMAIFAHNSVGAANILTGVMNAMLDSSAMIVITGDVWTRSQGRGAFQELATVRDAGTPDIFRGSVKRSWQVNKGSKLQEILIKAYKEAVSGRPGPVHIDITQEAFSELVDVELVDDIQAFVPDSRPRGSREATRNGFDILASAQRPVILAGGGAVRSHATKALVSLAEALNVPVTTTTMGKGVIPDDHPLHMGVAGWVGTVTANSALRNADVILAVGTRFSETDTAGWVDGEVFSIPPTRLVHVDIDPAEIGRNYPVAQGIVGDVRSVLEDMTELAADVPQPDTKAWHAQIEKWSAGWKKEVEDSFNWDSSPIEPGRLTAEIRKALPRDGIMMTDVGNSQKWIIQQFPLYEPDTFVTSVGGASMGFGPCGAPGAALAAKGRPTAVITGDGSMSMGLHILTDVVALGLPIVYIVANDYTWASVRGPQTRRFGADASFFTEFKIYDGSPQKLNFAAVAKAVGMESENVSDSKELPAALERAFASGVPYLLDVEVRRDTYVPMTGRGAYPLPPVE